MVYRVAPSFAAEHQQDDGGQLMSVLCLRHTPFGERGEVCAINCKGCPNRTRTRPKHDARWSDCIQMSPEVPFEENEKTVVESTVV